MAPVLRKRKAPPPAPEPAPKKSARVAKPKPAPKTTVKDAVKEKPAAAAAATPKTAAASKAPAVGDIISLDGFGGEVETNDGDKTTLKALVEKSKAGVVLFTYPKASTPGCKSHSSHLLHTLAEPAAHRALHNPLAEV
jgi:thioredoxin-dependent peroxiredoxin